jgi:aromatic ring hydroxylase
LSTNSAPRGTGARDGAAYAAGLRDDRVVWLRGQRVAVTDHPAFAGILATLRALYDRQCAPEHREVMTRHDPASGLRVSTSYLLPRTAEDLARRRANSEMWVDGSWGLLGRLPDYTAAFAVGLYDLRDELAALDARFGANAVSYHRFCELQDTLIAHAFVDPQIDRTRRRGQDPTLSLRVVGEDADGLVVRGSRYLATLGPLADEMLVCPVEPLAADEADFAVWFALPVATHGLVQICREPLGERDPHDHPLASRFDEPDAVVVFDDVRVPWERVFLYRDVGAANALHRRLHTWIHLPDRLRLLAKLRLMLGVAERVAQCIGSDGEPAVRERLGELACYVEAVAAEIEMACLRPEPTPGGLLRPADTLAAHALATLVIERCGEILRQTAGAAAFAMADGATAGAVDLQPWLRTYFRGHGVDFRQRAAALHLAWDLGWDGWGSRQTSFELLHAGRPEQSRIRLYGGYDMGPARALVERLLADTPGPADRADGIGGPEPGARRGATGEEPSDG